MWHAKIGGETRESLGILNWQKNCGFRLDLVIKGSRIQIT